MRPRKVDDLPERARQSQSRAPVQDVAFDARPGDAILEVEVLGHGSALGNREDGMQERPEGGFPLQGGGLPHGAGIAPIGQVVGVETEDALDVSLAPGGVGPIQHLACRVCVQLFQRPSPKLASAKQRVANQTTFRKRFAPTEHCPHGYQNSARPLKFEV